jgi:hypothetical protein
LFPTFDSSKDTVGIGGPDEGFWVGVCLGDEVVDGKLQFVEGPEHTALETSTCELAKKLSTALSQEAEVGVKWKHASLGYKPPAAEVFVPAFAAWPAPLRRAAPPATLAKRPTLN